MTNDMDYEKKYNEALERAKELLLGNEHSNTIRSYFEHIFPELRESEDERIRKWLVNYFDSIKTAWIHMDITCEKILVWLEKQKDINCLACDQHLKGYIAGRKVTEEEKQKEQDLAEMAQSKSPLSVAYANRCFENGKQAMKEQMMKEAVETELYWDGDFLTIDLNMAELGYSERDKVRVIVCKKED